MVGLNTYINDLDLSALKEYCVNHGQSTQYAKGDYFIKAGEELCNLLNSDGMRDLN